MIKSYKSRIEPTKQQQQMMFQFAGCARFIYNWTLNFQKERYEQGEKFLPSKGMSKYITELKNREEFIWLKQCDSLAVVGAYTDACNAFNNFFREIKKGNKNQGYPKFKSRNRTKPSFMPNYQNIKFTEDTVKIAKIGSIKLSRKNYIPIANKYSNPRVTFDGLHWYISVGVEEVVYPSSEEKEGTIGIDLGVKDTAILSNEVVYKNINKTKEIKKIEKRLVRLQRQVSRKYQMNKKGTKFVKTKNIIKLEKEINVLHKKLSNIRNNYNHKITSDIIKMNPKVICIEDLNIKVMMKNKHLAKAIAKQSLYEITRQLEYKCEWNDITLVKADRWYASSKTCSNCGYHNKELKLKDRVYKCPQCKIVIDRDKNASINLKKYAEDIKDNKIEQ